METNTLPLEGVKVVEMSTVVAGPTTARMLCSYGAEVIKVEGLDGDVMRVGGVHEFTPYDDDLNPLFTIHNSGKKFISLKYKTEEKLREMLHTIQTPTLILGAVEDPISTPELMMRTAKELPHCKLVMYSNTGHNLDTDLIEELAFESEHFLKQVEKDGRVYESVL